MTYAMWLEENVSNINVLHRVYLSNVVHKYQGSLQHLLPTVLSNPHSMFVATLLFP
jgi:hypothetical protein